MALQAIIFDLGGTLIDWPDWDEDINRRWGLSYDYLIAHAPSRKWPERDAYVYVMREAEKRHWQQVAERQASNNPTSLLRALQYPQNGSKTEQPSHAPLREGVYTNEPGKPIDFALDFEIGDEELLIAMDGYARAVNGWAIIFPDTVPTLLELRKRGYPLGLLSNTWWAAEWHNADLAAHGLTSLLDVVVYTSDLPYSKPHPSTFLEVTKRLRVEPEGCVMVGDRMIDDISGAQGVGMRAIWKRTDYPWPKPEEIVPSAVISNLCELPLLLEEWERAEK
jgi:putative hydrolase of the HAD superfamily